MKRSILSNEEAKIVASQVVGCIEATTTIDDLRESFEKLEVSGGISRRMQGPNYPRVNFRITEADVSYLKNAGIISSNESDSCLSLKLASGYKKEGGPLNPLEKILYAICWKNGDLGKERHILRGVMGDSQACSDGPVFFEFGQYLAGRNVFILDQHTVRAVVLGTDPDCSDVKRIRELDQIRLQDSSHSLWVSKYKEFFKRLSMNGLRDRDFFYFCDRILFGLGSLLKTPKKK